MQQPGIYRSGGKRCFDVCVSLALLFLVSPNLFLAALFIYLESGLPILFTQTRVGKDNEVFQLYKFRSMTVGEHDVTKPVNEHSAVITRVGYFLRRSKIDELPQLVNVLLGDMSLVGPRPTVQQSLNLSDPNCRIRMTLRPGMAGLAQVSGNISLTWPQRWVYDAEYVKSYSFYGDLLILLKAALVVVIGETRFKRVPEERTTP